LAMEAPRPRLAPVITAVRPDKSIFMLISNPLRYES
jgi:hypothetical protein